MVQRLKSTPSEHPVEYSVEGLEADVEIIVDRWGIPHISAQNRADVYLAQGFNAARDRLFQIDLWRRRGLGLLAEALGPEYVEQDRANRLMLYRGDMEAEWAAYGAGVRDAVSSFTAGVNAYIAWALEESDRLPPEFGIHGYAPALWDAADAVRFRTHGLFYNVEQEVARAQTMRSGGPVGEELRQKREPAGRIVVPKGLELEALDAEVLRTYRLAFAPVSFDGAARPESALEGVSGSNNWVVSGSRTSTGRPILANDPHRAVTLPSLRYIAHLRTPDLDVIGAGEPGLPGISIGHNEQVAFGLTIWPADVEDLYVYQLDAADAGRYLGPDGSTPFTVVNEDIPVRGASPHLTDLLFTVHGPVIHRDLERGIAVALRAAWLEPGMAPYVASLGYGDAADADAFVAALEHWGAPAVNHVFASCDGDWGWQVAAKVPLRSGWDGSLPVPGDGTFEWTGFAGASELPGERRPERGWIATANEANLPAEWLGNGITATHDWYSDARATRLREWLSADDRVSVESSDRMQNDQLSLHALRVLAPYADLDLGEGAAAAEFSGLIAWDGVEHADSREALIFQIWARRHLRPALVDARLAAEGVPETGRREALPLILKDESFGGDLRGDIALAAWAAGELSQRERTSLVARTMDDALEEIVRLLGDEEGASPWSWGRLHHSAVAHPALLGVAGVDPSWVRLGPTPCGGSGDTVGMAGYDAAFRQSIGSTFRMVVDVGDWDRSVVVNSPGQSGDPRSHHYADLFDGWAAGESFPLLYSVPEIERHADLRLVLRAR